MNKTLTNLAPQEIPPPPPIEVVVDGKPATGRYAGSLTEIDWSGLTGEFHRSALWRRFHHKRWHYVGIATEQCFIGVAIVDIGWTNAAFAYLFDRQSKTLLADFSQDGLPFLTARVSNQPTNGALSWFKHSGGTLRYEHVAGERYRLTVQTRTGLKIDARIDQTGAAPFLAAIGPVPQGGCAHSTVKSSALEVKGTATAGGQSFRLDDGVASFDYSNGLLARDTEWRWASAHSRAVGFNLQHGYFGNYENVLWLDGALIPLGQARFEFDAKQPLAPWHVSTDDGLLDLTFQPEGARQESKNLLVAASYYIQPIGTFNGTVKAAPDAPPRRVDQLVGVTEDHRSRW